MSKLRMKYFVLRPGSKHSQDRYAQAAREAMRSFADEIDDIDPNLAEELRIWAAEEAHKETKIKNKEIDLRVSTDAAVLRELEKIRDMIKDQKGNE